MEHSYQFYGQNGTGFDRNWILWTRSPNCWLCSDYVLCCLSLRYSTLRECFCILKMMQFFQNMLFHLHQLRKYKDKDRISVPPSWLRIFLFLLNFFVFLLDFLFLSPFFFNFWTSFCSFLFCLGMGRLRTKFFWWWGFPIEMMDTKCPLNWKLSQLISGKFDFIRILTHFIKTWIIRFHV